LYRQTLVGLSPNPYYDNILSDIVQILFRLRRSDIIAFAIVILKPCGFSVILFAKLGVTEYHYAKHNITAKQYNSPNVMRRIKLRDFLMESLANLAVFLFEVRAFGRDFSCAPLFRHAKSHPFGWLSVPKSNQTEQNRGKSK